MNQFVRDVVTPYWWISVVIVGIIIHVVGTFVTKKVEAGSGGVSKWWLKRTVAQREKRRKSVEELLNDPHEEIISSIRAVTYIIRSLAFSLLIFGSILIPVRPSNTHRTALPHFTELIVDVLTSIFFFVSILGIFVPLALAIDTQDLLNEVRRECARRKKLR